MIFGCVVDFTSHEHVERIGIDLLKFAEFLSILLFHIAAYIVRKSITMFLEHASWLRLERGERATDNRAKGQTGLGMSFRGKMVGWAGIWIAGCLLQISNLRLIVSVLLILCIITVVSDINQTVDLLAAVPSHRSMFTNEIRRCTRTILNWFRMILRLFDHARLCVSSPLKLSRGTLLYWILWYQHTCFRLNQLSDALRIRRHSRAHSFWPACLNQFNIVVDIEVGANSSVVRLHYWGLPTVKLVRLSLERLHILDGLLLLMEIRDSRLLL